MVLDFLLTMASNLGIAIENIFLIIAFLGGLVFAARDFRIATIYWFVMTGGVFLWIYTLYSSGHDVDYSLSLTLFLISLVIMSLNLLFIKQNSEVVI